MRRRLTVPGFLALAAGDVALITVLSLAVGSGLPDDGHLRTASEVAQGLLIPIGASLVYVLVAITWLGWWRRVLVDDRPVARWVRVVPAIFVAASLLAVDYGELADRGLGFTLTLALVALCVGFGEEGLFRGIGVVTLRANGLREGRVALWSSVVFGAVHIANALGTGSAALAQAFAVAFAGYFFYLTRRATGGLVVPALLHGFFDFSILSGTLSTAEPYAGSAAAILAYLLTAAVVVRRRRRIEPAD